MARATASRTLWATRMGWTGRADLHRPARYEGMSVG